MKDETKFLESMLDLTIELAQKVKNQNKLIETLTNQIKDSSGITEDSDKKVKVKATGSRLADHYEAKATRCQWASINDVLKITEESFVCPACNENNICTETGKPCDYCENDGGYEPR